MPSLCLLGASISSRQKFFFFFFGEVLSRISIDRVGDLVLISRGSDCVKDLGKSIFDPHTSLSSEYRVYVLMNFI